MEPHGRDRKAITTDPEGRMEMARELRDAFALVSPFIEKHTAVVCPECKHLCCKDKHGRYDGDDLAFLNAVGADIPPDHPGREESGPCRHMTDKGCALDRWMRPFRCTHFFCDPLLNSLENDNAKLYRAFVEYFQYLVNLRQRFLE